MSQAMTPCPPDAPLMVACALCGKPMPPGEEMFRFHGYSGPCPDLPLPPPEAISSLVKPLVEMHRHDFRLGLLRAAAILRQMADVTNSSATKGYDIDRAIAFRDAAAAIEREATDAALDAITGRAKETK